MAVKGYRNMNGNTQIKAWLVNDKTSDEGAATVVFAETRGKARAIAMKTNACIDSEFINILVNRLPQADKMYKQGKSEMDFDDPKDRLFLVKHCGFYCIVKQENLCNKCIAKKYCVLNEQ